MTTGQESLTAEFSSAYIDAADAGHGQESGLYLYKTVDGVTTLAGFVSEGFNVGKAVRQDLRQVQTAWNTTGTVPAARPA